MGVTGKIKHGRIITKKDKRKKKPIITKLRNGRDQCTSFSNDSEYQWSEFHSSKVDWRLGQKAGTMHLLILINLPHHKRGRFPSCGRMGKDIPRT